jgi:hypothetical protein
MNSTLSKAAGLAALLVTMTAAHAQTNANAAATAGPSKTTPAAASTTSPPPPPSMFDKFASEAKNPVSWMTWGADMRVRNEYFDNIFQVNNSDPLHEQDVIRYRGRLWASFFPFQDLSLNTRLSAEPREWMKPAFAGTYRGQTGMEWRYGIVDNLNLKWSNAFTAPLTITAGRQDISFGDYWNWWLVADGTPGDGSWAFFLDSIRLNYDAKDINTKFDVVYIYQNARPDEWLPTLGRSYDMYLTEQNEQGVILYGSNKSIQNHQLDGYFIYKRDDRVFPYSGAPSAFSAGDNADIFTVGGRVVGNPWEHWQYYAEGGYQFGRKQDPTLHDYSPRMTWRDIDAFGANARLSYLFKDSLNNQAHLVFEYLSGDDPKSNNDEMFDILWGRWPRFSEGYIYSYIRETGGKVAQVNNIERIGAGWSLNPIKNMTFSAYYNAWFAPQDTPTRSVSPTLFTGTGDFRGHYLQTILRHQFNKHVTAHLWGEFIWAGDYYTERDFMDFLRAEVLLTF